MVLREGHAMSDSVQTEAVSGEEPTPERSRTDPALVDRLMADAGDEIESRARRRSSNAAR